MRHGFIVRRARSVVAICLGVACFAPPVQRIAAFPSDLQVHAGDCAILPVGVAVPATAVSSNAQVVHVSPMQGDRDHIQVITGHVGEATVSEKLFGVLPWKAVHVQVLPNEKVIVGGQSVGIRLNANGALVIGYQRVDDAESPAGRAHVEIGDVIESVDHTQIRTAGDLRRCVNQSRATEVELQVRRGTERRMIRVTPITDRQGNRHLGLYVRDKAAGVGTLTFYNPVHHCFGALGHVITDADTGQPIKGTGGLYNAEIVGMVKGTEGKPGEKKGRFTVNDPQLGHIEENSPYGVFGSMLGDPDHELLHQAIPVALPSQIHVGPAKMLTVLHDHQVEAFDVVIENLVRQDVPSTKSMIVHVTDPRLLQASGGIVQGMSGSPLLQDGRLIGAVTHVFVSDPTRGYGVYAEWMVQEANHVTPPKDDADTQHQAASVPMQANMSKNVEFNRKWTKTISWIWQDSFS